MTGPAPGPALEPRGDPEAVWSGATPEEVRAELAPLVDFPAGGESLEAVRDGIRKRLLPHLVRYDHSGFHALYNFLPEAGASLGAEAALAWNQGVTNWQVSPGGVVLEELCCEALCRLFSLAEGAGATFMYSGTYANQQALYLALHRRAEVEGFSLARRGVVSFADPGALAVLASEAAHFSIRQTVRMLGLGERCLVPVETDDGGRLDPDALARRARELADRGRVVVAVVLTTGTSSRGAMDPVAPSMDRVVGALEGASARPWIHVDGAYGLSFRLLDGFEETFRGLERADSATWDPHKTLGVPIPSSVLFCRRADDLLRMAVHGDYFNRPEEKLPNPGLKSAPSTRPLSALPVVTTLRHLGLEGTRARLAAPLTAARGFAERARSEPDVELLGEPETGILCLRLLPPSDDGAPAGGADADAAVDEHQRRLYRRSMEEGERAVSLTSVDGRPALRFLVVAPTSTADTMMETLAHLRELAREVSAGG